MATRNTAQIMSLLSEVIQRLYVRKYEIKENWIMTIPASECNYAHHVATYDIQSNASANTISIDLLKIIKGRQEDYRNGY